MTRRCVLLGLTLCLSSSAICQTVKRATGARTEIALLPPVLFAPIGLSSKLPKLDSLQRGWRMAQDAHALMEKRLHSNGFRLVTKAEIISALEELSLHPADLYTSSKSSYKPAAKPKVDGAQFLLADALTSGGDPIAARVAPLGGSPLDVVLHRGAGPKPKLDPIRSALLAELLGVSQVCSLAVAEQGVEERFEKSLDRFDASARGADDFSDAWNNLTRGIQNGTPVATYIEMRAVKVVLHASLQTPRTRGVSADALRQGEHYEFRLTSPTGQSKTRFLPVHEAAAQAVNKAFDRLAGEIGLASKSEQIRIRTRP